MRRSNAELRESGARVAVIAMGSPSLVGSFCRQHEIPFDCLSDPDRSAYTAFGLKRSGPTKWANPRAVAKGTRLLLKGVVATLPHQGQDVGQMPGSFVIDHGGTVLLAHYSRDSSDNLPVTAMLEALKKR